VAEAFLRQGALAHLGLKARAVAELGPAGVGLAAMPPQPQLALRGEGDDPAFLQAAEVALEFALPLRPNTTARGEAGTACWLGPSEWLLLVPGQAEPWIERLSAALAGVRHALNDVSESRTQIRISGARAVDLLAKGTSLDLHPSVFPRGACAQSTLALADMLLHRPETEAAPVFDVYAHRSFADYLWRWLEGAAAEYGVVVLAPAAIT